MSGPLRTTLRVQWWASARRWLVHRRSPVASWEPVEFRFRFQAVRYGAATCRLIHATGGLAQLVVHNKRGRISFERTYGNDPRRTKG